MKDVIIKCEKGEVKKTLAYIERKRSSVRWASGDKPTGYDGGFEEYGVYLVIERDVLTFIEVDEFKHSDKKDKTVVSADEFLRKSKNPSIVIFRRDRNVIAKNVATGDEGIAKCSPDDDFVFKTGASIALARLMAKTPEVITDDVKAEWKRVLGIEDVPARVDHKFNVGDFVTLKEGLAGGKKYGALTLYSGRMYEYANGKRLEVETATFNESDGMYHYRCKATDGNYFYYTEAMLDKWNEGKIHEGDTVKVINTGLNYSSYVQWVGEHISDPYMAARFCFGSPSMNEKYKVIKIAEHEYNGRMLAYIEQIGGLSYNKCYLIEVKGLVKV